MEDLKIKNIDFILIILLITSFVATAIIFKHLWL